MAHFARETYIDRVEAVRAGMAAAGLSHLIITPSADLEYLTGLDIKPSDRLLALVLSSRPVPTIICPALEQERIAWGPLRAQIVPWQEHEGPLVPLLKELRSAGRIDLGGSTPFAFLEPLLHLLPRSRLSNASSVIGPLRARKGPEEVEAQRKDLDLV